MKKFLLFVMFTCMLVFCAMPALAATSDKSDATLDEVIVNDTDITIRNTMEVSISMFADEVELTVAPSHNKADVEIKSSSNCEYDADDEILYLDEEMERNETYTVTITVTSQDGENTKTYTLKLVRSYSSDLLEGLAINTSDNGSAKGEILLSEKDFESDTFSYDLKLADNSSAEYLYFWIDTDSTTTVWVNDKKVYSKDRLPYELELSSIKNTVEIRLEDEEELESAVYLFTIDQDNINTAKSALDELYVSERESTSSSRLFDLYPVFDPETSTYHVFLADGADEAYILAEAADRDYQVYYNYDSGLTTTEDDYNEEWFHFTGIREGSRLLVMVMDEDEEGVGAYSIVFHCGRASDNNDTDLDDLSISNQTGDSKYETIQLDQTFPYDKKKYTATVEANSYKHVRLYAAAFDDDAYVLVNGQLMGGDGFINCYCEEGKTYTYTIDVIAANCEDTDTYTLTVTYGEISKGAFLSGLSAKVYGGAALTLSPIFEQGKLNYTANVPNSVSYISFYPTAASAEACNIELFGYKQQSGVWTNYYQLDEGINNIPIYVYEGENKDKANIYYVTIYRQPAHLTTVVSSQKLTIDGKAVQLNAYNINGNNFVKLRDIAYLLNGTAKQFQVGFVSASNSVFITSNTAYTSIGQENVALSSPKRVVATSQSVYLNSAQVAPMAYNIDGNNYLMLRDLGLLLDFGMTYSNNTGTVAITTNTGYSPNK